MWVTAVYRKIQEGKIGYAEELSRANTQGHTLNETRENLKNLELIKIKLKDAEKLYESNKTLEVINQLAEIGKSMTLIKK